MHPAFGLVGAVVLTFGGFILFNSLYSLAVYVRGTGLLDKNFTPLSFFGFFLFSIGLWLIVLSGKPEMKHN